MRHEPEINGVSIVLLGSFKPSSFSPEWFIEEKLLPGNATHSFEIEVVSPLLTRFTMDWLQLHVDVNRFQISTLQYPCVRIRDLAMRVFHEFHPRSTFRAIGINRDAHFRLSSERERCTIKNLLAPIGPWAGISSLFDLSSEGSGMSSLTMRQIVQSDEEVNRILSVNVESSFLVENEIEGFHIQVNDHTDFGDDHINELQMVRCLESQFDEAITKGDDIIDYVMTLPINAQSKVDR